MSPTYPSAIEVFDLAENEDMLSPVEVDPEKLAHKYKEVREKWLNYYTTMFDGKCLFMQCVVIKHPLAEFKLGFIQSFKYAKTNSVTFALSFYEDASKGQISVGVTIHWPLFTPLIHVNVGVFLKED